MKLLFKLFFASALLIVLFIAAVVITLVYIDPNDYKESIASEVTEKTGRDIRIDGNINLSYYPWLGLEVEGISIGNVSGFGDKPFLQTKTVKVRVKLLPLLRKELEVDTFILHGTIINLAKNAKGVTNWDDLIKPQEKTESSSNALPFAALILGGIDIQNANIYWDDKQQGVTYKITNANISTDELKFGEPIDITASLNIAASKPALTAAVKFKGTVAYEDSGDVLLLEAKVKGKLKASGADLPALIKIATQFMGEGSNDLKSLSKQLAFAPKKFDIQTDFDIDLKSGTVAIPSLSIHALGMTAAGSLKVKKLNSDSPAFSGELKAKGPNLPLLMQIAGSMQDGDSALVVMASDLGKLKKKDFNIETRFDTDLSSGKINPPTLSFNAFGFKLNANLKGDNIQNSSGNMLGKILVSSQNPKPLLTALGYGDVAQVLKSIDINTGINGNTRDLNLKPFSLDAVFAGKNIPDSPVKLTVRADSEINLDKEIFNLSGLQVTGLGLDVKGSIKALNFKTEPAISGQIAVAPFDLRKLMQTLNMDVPKTADANVLKKVSFATAFTGTGTSFSLTDLKAQLDDTRLQGDINIKRLSPLDIEFGLGVDKLNADRYLPPKTNARPVTPEAVAVGAATGLPVETLQAIKIKGDFVMGSLIISNAKLSDMKFSIRADKGDINLAPIAAKLYKGSYAGDIHLDATGKIPKLTMNTNLQGVDVESLLIDVVGSTSAKGLANISLALSSRGADINTLRSTLAGKGNILFEKGTLIGVDIKSVLHQVEIMIETKNFGTPAPGEKTEFDKLTATLDIHNGVIDNHDLLMLGSGFSVTGNGMLLNLNDETWKYTLIAKADPTRVKQGEKTFNIGGHDIPIKCKGKITDKNCKPDVGAIAATIVQKIVLDKIFKGAGGKKSGSTSEEPVENIQDKVLKDIFDKIF